MDSRDRIIFTPIKSKKSENLQSFVQPHQELEFHVDESGRKYYCDDDDLIPVEEARVGSGSPKIETRSQDNNEATTKVIFADAVKPSKEDLAVEKKIPVKTHYDDFRGLYYIDAKALKSSSASPSSRGLFSGKLSESELNKTSEVVVIPKGVM